MPEDFLKCLRQRGSKVRTIKPKSNVYIPICFDKKGKSHSGEVKHVKETDKVDKGK